MAQKTPVYIGFELFCALFYSEVNSRLDELVCRLATFDGFSFYQMKNNANLGGSKTTGI
jgi:hypothetical protein